MFLGGWGGGMVQLSANEIFLSCTPEEASSTLKFCENDCGHAHLFICVVFHVLETQLQ
jgi:hypothetical protein